MVRRAVLLALRPHKAHVAGTGQGPTPHVGHRGRDGNCNMWTPAHEREGNGALGGLSRCNLIAGKDLRAKANRIRRLRLRGGALVGYCNWR